MWASDGTGSRPSEPQVSRGLAVLVGVVAGCLVGMQAPINSRLGRTVGSVQAATFSFLVGTVLLVLVAAFLRGGLGNFSQLGRVPWWALVGGLLGAIYVTVALIAVRTLGASGLTAVVITGQLAISVAIDRSACSAWAANRSVCTASWVSCCSSPERCSWSASRTPGLVEVFFRWLASPETL
jgi:transporter family-2 protein